MPALLFVYSLDVACGDVKGNLCVGVLTHDGGGHHLYVAELRNPDVLLQELRAVVVDPYRRASRDALVQEGSIFLVLVGLNL